MGPSQISTPFEGYVIRFLWLFADSDHAKWNMSNRSTSGCLLALVGPNTLFTHSQLFRRSRLQRLCHRQRLKSLRRTLLYVLLVYLPPACGQSYVTRGEIALNKGRPAEWKLVPKTPKTQKMTIGSTFHSPTKLPEFMSNPGINCITQLIRIVQ